MFRWIVELLALIWVALILGLTLTGIDASVEEPVALGWFCIRCGEFGTGDAVANLLMFVPLGAALGLLRLRPGRVTVLCALLSATIETTQSFIPGRYTSARDLVLNAAGAAAAAVVVRWVLRERKDVKNRRGR